ncbi:hypothetical protein KY285_013970 [Solanum tuberosum]|nr:hypothetical protein KY285_013970 [Solanum tuberosum]
MASLVLLLAELLRHENTDYLTSPSSSSVADSCAVVAAKGVSNQRVFNNSSTNFNTDFNLAEDFEELPKICVDFVWP